MRKCFCVLFFLGVIAISQAEVIGDFEGSLDNWGASWEGTSTLTIGQTAGTVTLGDYSVAVKLSDTGYWELQFNAPWDALPTDLTNVKLTFDLTMIASEWTSTNWTKVADKVAITSNNGWVEYTNATAIDRTTGLATSTDWGPWSGDAAKTYTVDISGYNVTGISWFQINISLQQNPADGAGYFYIDNIQLIPEPATLTMLGFGGLALLRRGK